MDRCVPRTKGGPQAQRVPRPKHNNGMEVQVLTKLHDARDRFPTVQFRVREVNCYVMAALGHSTITQVGLGQVGTGH